MICITTNTTAQVSSNQEGQDRKDAAFLLLEAKRSQIIREARKVLLERLLQHGTATIDDVRNAITLPDGINPKCFGAVPGTFARANIIRSVGFVQTSRPKAHARPVTVWELADAAKAERWLATYRALPVCDAETDI